MALTTRTLQRYVVTLDLLVQLDAVTPKAAVDASLIRQTLGFESTNAGLSSTIHNLVNAKLASKEKINQTVNKYMITKAGLAFVKKNASVLQKIEDKHKIYEPSFKVEARRKEPEAPTTEVENAAITGLAKLIDDNKNMRGLLSRFKLEIENALADQ